MARIKYIGSKKINIYLLDDVNVGEEREVPNKMVDYFLNGPFELVTEGKYSLPMIVKIQPMKDDCVRCPKKDGE